MEKDKNPRVRLYAVTAYYVYQQCFLKAGIIDGGKFEKELWAPRLIAKLQEAFTANKDILASSYEGYIRDRFNNACTAINAGDAFKWIGYSRVNFNPLLHYAGIANSADIDCAFKIPPAKPLYHILPVSGSPLRAETGSPPEAETVPFVYTSRPYPASAFFSRITEGEGYLCFHPNGDCEFTGMKGFKINKEDLISADPYTMRPDKEPCWVKLTYNGPNGKKEGYFARPLQAAGPLLLAPAKGLADRFNAQLTR